MAKKITNTTKLVHDDPMAFMSAAFLFGASEAIEGMEAMGQAELVASDQIPTDLQDCTEADLERLGFVLGPVEPDDPLFRQATLPAGWTKIAVGDHAMWSHILDDLGRVRFRIFYKAAHYDRHAQMGIERRYDYSIYVEGSTPERYAAVVKDDEAVMVTLGERDRDDFAAGDVLRAKCEEWLDEYRPDWRNPLAYWENPS